MPPPKLQCRQPGWEGILGTDTPPTLYHCITRPTWYLTFVPPML